jgi:hypothetical protein
MRAIHITTGSSPRALRIGITADLHGEAHEETHDTEEQRRSVTALARCLTGSPQGHQVWLVSPRDEALPAVLPWELARFATAPLAAVEDGLDVLIEAGARLDSRQRAQLAARGTRRVRYCAGAPETISFSRSDSAPCDAIWATPPAVQTWPGLTRALRRGQARVVPLLWDPAHVTQRCAHLPHAGEYRPQPGAKPLTLTADAVDVTRWPRRVAQMIAQIAAQADVHVSVAGRADRAWWPAPGGLVLAHRRDVPHAYLDLCWQGYALIHNARLCATLGYGYAGELREGVQRLRQVLATHDDRWSAWQARQRVQLAHYRADSAALVAIHDALLAWLMGCPS